LCRDWIDWYKLRQAAGIGPAKCNADNAVTISHPESGFVVNVELPRLTAVVKLPLP
jgi:hypothetical protein